MQNIYFNFDINPLFLLLILIVILGFTLFIYKYTLPELGKGTKLFLVSLRTLILFLIIALLFEPSINIIEKNIINNPVRIFVDNSLSVKKDSSSIFNITGKIENELKKNSVPLEIYSFGENVSSLRKWESGKSFFTSAETNFNTIWDTLNKHPNSTAIIISDGNFNSGDNPVDRIKQLNSELYVVGVGDTTPPKDISVEDVEHNPVIFNKKVNEFKVTIKNNGFGSRKVWLNMFEGKQLVSRKQIKLNPGGLNLVDLTYKPTSTGQKKLRFSVSGWKTEQSIENNEKTIYVDVVKGKINTLLVSSSPNFDYSFIYKALKEDENIEPRKLLLLKGKENKNHWKEKIDSADVLLFINFPQNPVDGELMQFLKSTGKSMVKPVFLLSSSKINNELLDFLNCGIKLIKRVDSKIDVQSVLNPQNLYVTEIFGASDLDLSELPPLSYFPHEYKLSATAGALVYAKIGNSNTTLPLIITNNLKNTRTITALCSDIWKWKMNASPENFILNNFISSSVKWLNAIKLKNKISVKPVKFVFNSGEKITFTASVIDDAANPVENADINVSVFTDEGKTYDLKLIQKSSGIYEAGYSSLPGGEYRYKASVKYNSKIQNIKGKNFTVETFNPEYTERIRNRKLLKSLALKTNGNYFDIENSADIIELVSSNKIISKKEVVKKSNFLFRENQLILLLIIVLFSLDWFVRKRAGLL